MKKRRKRKCRHCKELFHPDPRNLRHQKYCSKPDCRKASKAASQRRWLGKTENRDYFRGPENVQRVQAWRQAHPRYWQKRGTKTDFALQEDLLAQAVDTQGKSDILNGPALQRFGVKKVQRKCKACGGHFSPRPQNPDQQFCSKRECQRERKRRWQKHKRATDADYRDNQARARQRWAQAHPDYWRTYRRDHPDYTARNRALQRERDRRRREDLAKMDASGGKSPILSGSYWLVAATEQASTLAKMDACRVQLTVLPKVFGDCPILQRDDSMGTAAAC